LLIGSNTHFKKSPSSEDELKKTQNEERTEQAIYVNDINFYFARY